MGLQGGLVAADGPLRAAVLGHGGAAGWRITQVALAVLGLVLAGVGRHPDALWVVGAIALAIALASASQDIAIDAYAVEVLRPEEQGAAVGARIALYRAAMAVSRRRGITLAAHLGWPTVNVLLALLYIPMLLVTWKAPEPDEHPPAPRTLRDAVWLRSSASSRATARSRSSPSSSSTSSPTSWRRR